jgi:hypothetical protein
MIYCYEENEISAFQNNESNFLGFLYNHVTDLTLKVLMPR